MKINLNKILENLIIVMSIYSVSLFFFFILLDMDSTLCIELYLYPHDPIFLLMRLFINIIILISLIALPIYLIRSKTRIKIFSAILLFLIVQYILISITQAFTKDKLGGDRRDCSRNISIDLRK
jgi:hypothetical protein